MIPTPKGLHSSRVDKYLTLSQKFTLLDCVKYLREENKELSASSVQKSNRKLS